MTQTAKQLRQRATEIRTLAQMADGPAYHREMQEADHLIAQAEKLEKTSAPQEKKSAGKDQQRKRDLAAIHTLAKKAGLEDDDSYRDMLEQLTGQRSAAKLSRTQRYKVIQHLKANAPKRAAHYPDRPNNTDTSAQMKKIEALLAEAKYPWSYAKAIAKRMYHKEQLEFCTSTELTGVISALIKDAKKHGRRIS